MQKRICHKCNSEYEYNESGNMMIFCPNCKHSDLLCCDFGFGPVTPCNIDLGAENVAKVISEEDGYRLVSEKFRLDRKLTSRYMEALGEAGNLISDLL
ncbi:MAG: hypothetical protein IJ869_02925 [Clostridiales bacterium]|nr:hypothetical protein [Clostridiales bacterium]